jgi:serine/threonine protein kinase
MTDEHHPTVLTNPGTAVGTVLYMSPEQALGDPLDQRTDLFSLGLVLYEMLTGRRAFEGRSTTAIVDAILHATPSGLEAADISNVPKDLRRLLTRLLDKDRDRRPATAAEVAAQLRAVQSGSIAGREYAAAFGSDIASAGAPRSPSSIVKKMSRLGSRDGSSGLTRALSAGNVREAAVFAVVLLLLVLGGYGVFTWYRGQPKVAVAREPLLLTEFENTTGETVFDGALKDALEIQLQQSPYVSVVPRSQVRSTLQLMARSPDEPVTDAVARDLCERLGVKAIVLGSIAPLAPAYVITLEARACRTGDRLATEQIQAASKTNVLASVSAASASIRASTCRRRTRPPRRSRRCSRTARASTCVSRTATRSRFRSSSARSNWIRTSRSHRHASQRFTPTSGISIRRRPTSSAPTRAAIR